MLVRLLTWPLTERGWLLEREKANERRNDTAAATSCECPSYYKVESTYSTTTSVWLETVALSNTVAHISRSGWPGWRRTPTYALPEKVKRSMSVVRFLGFEAVIETFGITKDHTSYHEEGGTRAGENEER